jgi:hypothetical protein
MDTARQFLQHELLATDQPGNEQYLFGFRVKSAFHGWLSRSGTGCSRKASVGKFFETMLGFQQRIVVVGVKFVSAVTVVV